MSGGNSLQKNVSSSVTARQPKPNARRPLDDPLRGAPLTKPATPAAKLLSSRRGPRAEEGLPTPRHRLLRLLAGPHPRSRLAETPARQVPGQSLGRVPCPTPASAHTARPPTRPGGPGHLWARAPLCARIPQSQHNGFRGAC